MARKWQGQKGGHMHLHSCTPSACRVPSGITLGGGRHVPGQGSGPHKQKWLLLMTLEKGHLLLAPTRDEAGGLYSTSLMVQRVKNSPAMQETQVRHLDWEIPLEEEILEMAIYSNILVWKIPWTEEPGGLQSTGSQRVDWACTYVFGFKGRLPFNRLSDIGMVLIGLEIQWLLRTLVLLSIIST